MSWAEGEGGQDGTHLTGLREERWARQLKVHATPIVLLPKTVPVAPVVLA